MKTSNGKTRIAFDLDETLGTPVTDGYAVIGFNFRTGCLELLDELSQHYELILWTVSSRTYVQKILQYGLGKYFRETYSWDELPNEWKDIRQIDVEYLIDDSESYREMAAQHGIESGYIIIPAYGSVADNLDSLAWIRHIRNILL